MIVKGCLLTIVSQLPYQPECGFMPYFFVLPSVRWTWEIYSLAHILSKKAVTNHHHAIKNKLIWIRDWWNRVSFEKVASPNKLYFSWRFILESIILQIKLFHDFCLNYHEKIWPPAKKIAVQPGWTRSILIEKNSLIEESQQMWRLFFASSTGTETSCLPATY